MNTPWARVARAEFDELQLVPDAAHLVPVSISEPQLLRQALSSEDGPLRSRLIKKFSPLLPLMMLVLMLAAITPYSCCSSSCPFRLLLLLLLIVGRWWARLIFLEKDFVANDAIVFERSYIFPGVVVALEEQRAAASKFHRRAKPVAPEPRTACSPACWTTQILHCM